MIGVFVLSLMVDAQPEKEVAIPSLDAFVFSSSSAWTLWISGIPYESLGPVKEGWSIFKVTENSVSLKNAEGREIILST